MDADLNSLIQLCPVGVGSIGPLAARCLALLCHAAPPTSQGLVPHLSSIAPHLSCALGSWLDAVSSSSSAQDDADGGGAAAAAGGLEQPMLDGSAADCASAALQLLGAAAEVQPSLFRLLSRGGLIEGEAVARQDTFVRPLR